jgi:hypothetical protein
VNDAEPWASAGRWFDKTWYLLWNPDVARAGIDPLAHYLRYGEAEGRHPSPWFDPAWYRAAYGVPANEAALSHFLTRRTTGQFLPCAALYPVPFLTPWRDDIDPFDHYLRDREVPERELLPALPIIGSSGLIGAAYYQINPVDPFEAALDPVLHYCRFGWRRRQRPNTAFDPVWYTETNQAAALLGIDLLTHYILQGEPANRRPVPWFDPAWYRIQHDVPPETLALAHYLHHRHGGTVSPNPLFDTAWYVARHGQSIPPDVDPFTHYLVFGAVQDINPSPLFDARAWRHRHMAPVTATDQSLLPLGARNPLVHHLHHVHRSR